MKKVLISAPYMLRESEIGKKSILRKIAQMMVYHMRLDYITANSPKWQEIDELLETDGIGLLHVWVGDVPSAYALLNEMQNKNGSVLVGTLLMLTIAALVSGGLLNTSVREERLTVMMNNSNRALYAAEAGLEQVKWDLQTAFQPIYWQSGSWAGPYRRSPQPRSWPCCQG